MNVKLDECEVRKLVVEDRQEKSCHGPRKKERFVVCGRNYRLRE